MATPVLEAVRRHYPNAQITALCLAQQAALLAYDPNLDEIFSFHRPSGYNRRSQQQKIIKQLRQGQYDLGLLLTNSLSSAWWFWRGHVSRRLGYATHLRSLLLTDPAAFPNNRKEQHLVHTYLQLLQPLDIPFVPKAPRLYLTEEERDEARSLLKRYRVTPQTRVVGVNPGAAYGTAKCWPPEKFRKLTEMLLQEKDLVVLFFGDASSGAVVDRICIGLPERVINLARMTTLRELMALIASCNVFVTNDSGPMHIAAALGVPLVALFGSTDEKVTGPYQTGKVIHKHVACSPCFKRICPIDFRCMQKIEPAEVYQEIKRKL
jgi:heptosyltransferase-2